MEALITLPWILFCIYEGWNDARIFAHGTGHYIKQNVPYNIHVNLWVGRALIFGFFIGCLFLLSVDFFMVLKVGVGITFLFPFFHEMTYYVSRKLIDNPAEYPDKWVELLTYSSTSTTAKTNFPFWLRLLMLIVGLSIIYA